VTVPPIDDGGDEDPEVARGGPPHPMDRIWRHPSELPAIAPPPRAAGGTSLRRSLLLSLGAGAIGALLTVGILAAAGAFDQQSGNNRGATLTTDATPASDAIASVTRHIAPAIVAVRVTSKKGARAGSGVCIRRGGQVLTSDRLVADTTSVAVVTSDGKAHTARVIGRDPSSDLALLSIDGELDAADLEAPGRLRIGDSVYAVGTDPAGSPWVSAGMVSSLTGRIASAGTTMSGLIEISSVAEPNAAGGALLDSRGRVVGILMTPVPNHPAAVAVPISFASRVADGLRSAGYVDHGWLGLAAKVTAGGQLVITALAADGPSERAGMRVGDVVVEVDSQPVATMDDLMAAVRGHWPGDKIHVAVVRDRSDHTLAVRLARKPDAAPTTTAALIPVTTTTAAR